MLRWRALFWVAGRLPRKPYWLGVLALLIVSLGARILSEALGPPVSAALYALAQALVAWVAICIFTRRLHDLGRSGWWQLPAFGLTVAGFATARPEVAAAMGTGPTGQAVGVIVGLAAYFGFIISLGIVRGMSGDNRFGRDPHAAAAA